MDLVARFLGAIRHDPVTATAIGLLVAGQIGLYFWFRWRTRRPLRTATARARELQPIVKNVLATAGTTVKRDADELTAAIALLRASGPLKERQDPEHVLASDRVLPASYNQRLDAAAPGIFTALGIIGTFLGLGFAFIQLDFSNASASISPLLAGMTLAFMNSLIGVSLAVWWTIRSRLARHGFDAACSNLRRAVEAALFEQQPEDQVLVAFANLAAGLSGIYAALNTGREDAARESEELQAMLRRLQEADDRATERIELAINRLQAATAASSNSLVDTLAPRLEQTFKNVVDMPFDRLADSVSRFETVVDALSTRHGSVLEGLDRATTMLSDSERALAGSLRIAADYVSEFHQATVDLAAQVSAARGITEQADAAAVAMGESADALAAHAAYQAGLTAALEGGVQGLNIASGRIDGVSERFEHSASRLAEAAGKIENVGRATAADSAEAVRVQLEGTVREMTAALEGFGRTTAEAYEASSEKVIGAVDNHMTDLTERLSAELATLSKRLPEVADEITRAVKETRLQLDKAVKALDHTVKELDAGAERALKTQLTAYDGALARAVDHFSGTLATWDDKVGSLTATIERLRLARQSSTKAGADAPEIVS